jgi:Ca2+-dependent lipid-binding protein
MEQSGTLYARLVRATGLKSVDSDGPSDIHSGHSQSDPYVRLSLGERTHRSKTCKKTNDPVWEETFMFKGTLRELLAEPLQLQVMTDG